MLLERARELVFFLRFFGGFTLFQWKRLHMFTLMLK